MSSHTHFLLEDKGKDFKFPIDFGMNIVFNYVGYHDKKYKIRCTYPDVKPREVILKISSFAGWAGGVHSYAKLSFRDWPRYTFASNGKSYSECVVQEYGKNDLPFGVKHVELEVTRRSDKRDVKYDKDQAKFSTGFSAYGHRKLGDWTYQFWSDEEARQVSIDWFKKHFDKGWVLIDEDDWDKKLAIA